MGVVTKNFPGSHFTLLRSQPSNINFVPTDLIRVILQYNLGVLLSDPHSRGAVEGHCPSHHQKVNLIPLMCHFVACIFLISCPLPPATLFLSVNFFLLSYTVFSIDVDRTVERGGGGVVGVGGPGPAKVLFNEKFDCSFGPSAIKYPWVRTGSRRPWT